MNVITKCNHILCLGRTSVAIASVDRTLQNGKVVNNNVCSDCLIALEDLFSTYPDISHTVTVL